jgi:hypothetical protein
MTEILQVLEVELTEHLHKLSLRIHKNVLLAIKMNVGYNESAFVIQILLQFGRQNLCN